MDGSRTSVAFHEKADGDMFEPSQLFGRILDNKDVAVDPKLFSKQDVGLVFCASWDDRSREFTAWLKDYLVKHPKKKIIVIPTDTTLGEYQRHRKRMDSNWYAIPFETTGFIDDLKRRHGVWHDKDRKKFGYSRNCRGGFPTVVVVDWDSGHEKKMIDLSWGRGVDFWEKSLALWDQPDPDIHYGIKDLGYD